MAEQTSIATDDHHKLYEAYHDRNNRDKIPKLISQLSGERYSLGLADARSCLAIGAGDGILEIEFVRNLMPDLKTFTAVEPDAPSAEHLKRHLQQHLPKVESVVHQMTVQEYLRDIDDSRKPYDAVLMLHVLYYVDKPDRKALFKSLVDDYVRPGVIVVDQASRRPLDMFDVLATLNPERVPIPSSEDLDAELQSVGFTLNRKCEVGIDIQMTDIDENFTGFWSQVARRARLMSSEQPLRVLLRSTVSSVSTTRCSS